ncbi:hypothetical protein [Streptomyces zingiberis]|uniref:Uncharacterized protein n=1 Tax=Streptomyces zingiberis TaxID=2053010 RepID=A0ABX1C6Z3_9ACTN|nr:hypothetical protein [Streptomyces zingiberis]NJQ03702.1 hypothetical protein [Streptomyces zingiberis]
MLRVYYRFVYWKRRTGRALGLGGPGRGAARRPRARRNAVRARMYALRPLWVFAAIVAVVLVASAVAGGWSGPYRGSGLF